MMKKIALIMALAATATVAADAPSTVKTRLHSAATAKKAAVKAKKKSLKKDSAEAVIEELDKKASVLSESMKSVEDKTVDTKSQVEESRKNLNQALAMLEALKKARATAAKVTAENPIPEATPAAPTPATPAAQPE